jgi:hypothetical protein
MKKLIGLICSICFTITLMAQNKNINIVFENDYKDVFHLALVVYMPDGTGATRVSNVAPNQTKPYQFPAGSEIYIADWKQEAFAMKGNDIKKAGVKPYKILTASDNDLVIKLSSLSDKSKTDNVETAIKSTSPLQ